MNGAVNGLVCFLHLSCAQSLPRLYCLRIVTMYVSVVECMVRDDEQLIGIASHHKLEA